jgi:pimeloyl-ACP methyl ester carboxylesterase
MRRASLPRTPALRVPRWATPSTLRGAPSTLPPSGRPAPSTRLLLAEAPRAAGELAALGAAAPALAVDRRGDGHPVLVLPGMLGGDLSTTSLRGYLKWLGYSVHGWELGTNVGPTEAVVSKLRARLGQLAESSGRRVSIVGWSLGGLYAHELARRSPGTVRQVITLGSPVRLARRDGSTTSQLFDRFSHLHVVPSVVPRPWTEAGTLRVPATAVYSRSDGIVAWRSCLLPPAKRRENVEVYGSHYGLAHNPTVLHVLADRLAQPERTWRPFSPSPLVRRLYPPPRGR